MAKPPSLRGLAVEDFRGLDPAVRKGLEQLASVLNPFLADTTDALAGRLTFGDNSDAVIKTVEFSTESWVPATAPTLPASVLFQSNPYIDLGASGLVGYWDGDEIVLRGRLKIINTPAAGTIIGVLNPEYRPKDIAICLVVPYRNPTADNTARPATLDIGSSGNVVVRYYDTATAGNNGLMDVVTRFLVQGTPPAVASAPSMPEIAVSLEAGNRKLGASKPSIVIPLACVDVSTAPFVTVPTPRVAWEHSDSGIVIRNLEGLDYGRRYRLSLLISS